MANAAIVARIQIERRFFTGMAVAMTLFVFAGFAPTYFLYPVIGIDPVRGDAPLTPLVHVHVAVSSAWLLFLILQTGLVMGGQYRRHMRNGMIGLGLAVAVIVIGVAVAVYSARSGRTPPGWTPTGFLVVPLTSVTLFGGYVAAGLLWRRFPEHHKRLMLLATMAILVPAGARFARHFLAGFLPPGVVGGMILSDVFLAALVLYDLRSRGRLHPVTLWGGLFMVASQPARMLLSETAVWNGFAAALIG